MPWYVDSPSFTAATIELVSWARRQHEDRGIAVFDQALDVAVARRQMEVAVSVLDGWLAVRLRPEALTA